MQIIARQSGGSQRLLHRLARERVPCSFSSSVFYSREASLKSASLQLTTEPKGVQRRCFAAKTPKSVDVVLREQIDELGYKGQHLQVSPGYARNYLVPEQLAVYASPANVNNYKVTLSVEEEAANAQERRLNLLRKKISSTRLRFNRATTDGIELYGAISTDDLISAIRDHKTLQLKLKPENIRFPDQTTSEFKNVGEYRIEVEAEPNFWCEIPISIGTT